ncbi:MAG: hypothetical protein WKF37_17200 [Bryobacteraceae bacterium]
MDRLSPLCSSVEEKDAIGLVFRHRDANNFYRYSMDGEGRYRRLTCWPGKQRFSRKMPVYQQNQDYHIAVEAVGSSLQISGWAVVFAVADGSP